MRHEEALFCLAILMSNIIQGITGFAGTLLALPFGVLLVGADVARPVLNVLGLLSGSWVSLSNRRHVLWRELCRILPVMTVAMAGGYLIRGALAGKERVLCLLLGGFVLVMAAEGLYRQLFARKKAASETSETPENAGKRSGIGDWLMLAAAGVVHGLFVSGGALLVGYLSRRVKDKSEFRATMSAVWIVLNGLLLITDLATGAWNMGLLRMQLLSLPVLVAGMVIGGKLVKIMSQRAFMLLTYVLLVISGVSLFLKA